MLRTLIISAATIGLSGALMTAPAIADHKPNHNPGGGGGGGDATYEITLTNIDVAEVASGTGVEGPGGSIDGLTEFGSFEEIALGSISTPDGNVVEVYNSKCHDVNGDVNAISSPEIIDDIRVVPNPEINELTVVVNYTVGDQSFILLLAGDFPEVFPPSAMMEEYPLTMWGNRGGGKGKKKRCGIGAQALDGVTLKIVPTP